MKALEEIERALAERREREREKARNYSSRKRREGHPHSPRTKAKLAQIAYERRRDEALADPDCHPLRRARVTFGGGGLSQVQLGERALVSARTIHAIESGEAEAAPMTARRLARALKATPAALGL
ncbi:MAG: helix-turn-helix transcriptional regulator [Solirubrobacterales bacterium]|nr:helix-turn-helix transcriptional regulator [Solirubrobacterales bacterium]